MSKIPHGSLGSETYGNQWMELWGPWIMQNPEDQNGDVDEASSYTKEICMKLIWGRMKVAHLTH